MTEVWTLHYKPAVLVTRSFYFLKFSYTVLVTLPFPLSCGTKIAYDLVTLPFPQSSATIIAYEN